MNRRNFGRIIGLGAVGITLGRDSLARLRAASADSSQAPAGNLQSQALTLDLGGNSWSLREKDAAQSIPAHVPGDNYTDLLRAGKIPDPYYRDNNENVQWPAERTWLYERSFDLPPDFLAKEQVQLVCHGLDSLATVTVNGQKIGSADNMFRTWIFDIKEYLKAGANTLQIQFDPQADFVRAREAKYKEVHRVDFAKPESWIRKANYQWGWDWCRKILTVGIWRNIELLAFDERVTDLAISQQHDPSGSVALTFDATFLAGQASKLSARFRLVDDREIKSPVQVVDSKASASLVINKPKLWWPNGMGEQNLYVAEVQLLDETGTVLDTFQRRFGVRKFEVIPATTDEAMQLRVNGIPFFVKGADWIPLDNLIGRITPALERSYMEDAAACHFNFLRLWGGGIYESDTLFDACDELGIVLQFEFKFANTRYPVFDTGLVENIRAEARDNILRTRNHPSIAIWSGNNEIEFFEGYTEIFDAVIGNEVRRLVPDAFYEVGSGAFGSVDVHDWSVWHGNKPPSSYDLSHGFVSEFGMQSFPAPASVLAYTSKEDRASVLSPVMVYHELSGDEAGIRKIVKYTQDNMGPLPANFDDALWLTQIMQAYVVRYGVEHWRRDRPRSMASVIWQYNDSWPGPTWSMVDYFRRWKALQYHARHMFAPQLVSGKPDAILGTMDLYVVNDALTGGDAEVSWQLTDSDGKALSQDKIALALPTNSSRLVNTVRLSDAEKALGLEKLLLWLELRVANQVVATNVAYFVTPRQLALPASKIELQIEGAAKSYTVTLLSKQPALWSWLTLDGDPDARYSDNFIHLRPNQPAKLTVACSRDLTPDDFHSRLRAHHFHNLSGA